MRGLEQAQQALGAPGIDGIELRLVPDVGRAWLGRPLGSQVATVRAAPHAGRVLGIGLRVRLEVRATPAERDFQAVADLEVDQLRRDVLDLRATRRQHRGAKVAVDRVVRFPVAVADMGIVDRGRRMRDAGGRHHARRHPALLSPLQDRPDALRARDFGAELLAGNALVDGDGPVVGLDAGDHGGRGRRRIRSLLVRARRDRQGQVAEPLEAEPVPLAVDAALLAVEDASRGDRGHAHAVADEENDVLRAACVQLAVDQLVRLDGGPAGAEPLGARGGYGRSGSIVGKRRGGSSAQHGQAGGDDERDPGVRLHVRESFAIGR